MEEKRIKFPRFYFLSNDELIDILANSQNMNVIQQHLKTLFDNIVRIDHADETVEAINSSEKE
jgi:dynein heavy chain